MRFILILMLLVYPSFAGESGGNDPKLPPDVQKVVDAHDAEVAKAKAAYEAAVTKANETGAKAMDAVVKARMAKQDLAGAVAAKAVVEKWRAEQPDPLGEAKSTIVIQKAEYGIEGRYVDCTKFIKDVTDNGKKEWQSDDSIIPVVGDPASGAHKGIRVTYLVDGKKTITVFPYHEVVKLGQ
jgi:hypothetical protein